MGPDRTIFDEPHYQSLELIAATALADGDPRAAFKFADRRCRILPVPEPHCYVLRGEASFRLGAKADGIADISTALEIAPDDLAGNRRMLAWARGDRQVKAALALIRCERDLAFLRAAISTLRAHGHRDFANVTILDERIEGWVAWDTGSLLEISITDGVDDFTTTAEPQPSYPLGGDLRVAHFSVRRPRSAEPQSIVLAVDGREIHRTSAAANEREPEEPRRAPIGVKSRAMATVIVPVYGDHEATRLCLDSLRNEIRRSGYRATIVNDATPNSRIAKLLAQLGKERYFDVLTNACNCGFVASVNRALRLADDGDVLILNSDTVLPPGCIGRLAAIAQSSADIGTVTPLSNNGEFTSFPRPNIANPLPSRREIERLDRIAAKANAGRVIDIPSGIGFCLYVTRACLDAVGSLSEDFGHGYLEDTDFCLRARSQGFRSVSAPSVYVGHAGSRSFGADKRSLVVRNLRVIEQRFPDHRSECAAFVAADPLQPAREAIERAAPTIRGPRLFVTGAGAIATVAWERAQKIAPRGRTGLILEVRHEIAGTIVGVTNASGAPPQSLAFKLSSASERDALFHYLRMTKPAGIEFLDPANTPPPLLDIMLRLKLPHDIFIADVGLLGSAADKLRAKAATRSEPASQARTDVGSKMARAARYILVPSKQARAFAKSVLRCRTTRITGNCAGRRHKAATRCYPRSAGRIGLVPVRGCAEEQALIGEIARGIFKARPETSIAILGGVSDDTGMMAHTNAFVTGAIETQEFARVAGLLGVKHLFVGLTRPLFDHPILSAIRATQLDVAYFDWSGGRCKPDKGDLALDPLASLADVIGAVSGWMR